MKLLFLKVDESSSCLSAVHILVTIVINVVRNNLIAFPRQKKTKPSKENRSFSAAYCLEMK